MTSVFHRAAEKKSVFHQRVKQAPSEEKAEPKTTVFHQKAATKEPIQPNAPSFIPKAQAPAREVQATPVQHPEVQEFEQAVNMPREEFLKLPFEQRAEMSRLIGNQASEQAARALTRGMVPGFERLETVAKERGVLPQTQLNPGAEKALEFAGAAVPIGVTGKAIAAPVETLLKNYKTLRPLARMLGWGTAGATYEGIRKLADKGEVPSLEEVGENALWWGGLEGVLASLGWTARMAKSVNTLSKATGEKKLDVFRALSDEAKASGLQLQDLAVQGAHEAKVEVAKDFLQFAENAAKEAEVLEGAPKAEAMEIAPPHEIAAPEAKEAAIPKPPSTEAAAPTEKPTPLTKETELKPSLIDKLRKRLGIEKSELNEKSWDLVRNMLGEKWAREYKSHVEWLGNFKKEFPNAKERSDMMFYREKPEYVGKKRSDTGTGNLFHNREETFEQLESRLSPKAKEFVDKDLDQHFKGMLEEFNNSPYTKKINPREFLEHVYLPHFYDGDIKKAAATFSKSFKTDNPLRNMRSFLTFNEALQKAGLVPKFKELGDLMLAYDNLMVRIRTNAELAGKIRELETQLGKKLIVRSGNTRYDTAKAEGWVPFEDPYLRRTAVGTGKDGKPIFATTQAPALVHPDLAESLQGVFVKNFKQTPTNFFGKAGKGLGSAVEAIDNFVKRVRLKFSPFHYATLAESYHAAKGTPAAIKDLFTYGNFAKKIDAIMNNPSVMDEMLRAGLVVHPPVDAGLIYKDLPLQKLLRTMQAKGGIYKTAANVVEKAGKPFEAFNNYLFGKFHPRLKVSAYLGYKDAVMRYYQKKGLKITPEEMRKIDQQIARVVNNQFGGQRWELVSGLNNPQSRKWLERFIAYPDWTISALREAQDAFSKDPVTRKLAHGYLRRYIAQLFTGAQLANLMTTGLYNKSDGSIGYDWNRARTAMNNPDPTKNAFSVQLPDITIEIGGHKIPVGRDEKGRHLYVHQGKKLFELAKYISDPVKEVFSKSRPGIQFATEQMTGVSPSLKNPYPVRGGYKGGSFLPWEGTKYPQKENIKLRAQHAAEMLVPFSLSGIAQKGAGPYLASGLGALPVSKGASMFSMEDYLREALRDRDTKRFQQYVDVLRQEGYEESSIKRLASRINKEVMEERKAEKKAA